MINTDPRFLWVYVRPSNPSLLYHRKYGLPKTKEDLQHWGKWVIFGQMAELEELIWELDSYVEKGKIHSVKYFRQPPPELGIEQPVMGVYCDDRDRERVWEILSNLGVTEKQWIYDKDIVEEYLKRITAVGKLSPERIQKLKEKLPQHIERWDSHLVGETDEGPQVWNFEQLAWKIAREKRARKG